MSLFPGRLVWTRCVRPAETNRLPRLQPVPVDRLLFQLSSGFDHRHEQGNLVLQVCPPRWSEGHATLLLRPGRAGCLVA